MARSPSLAAVLDALQQIAPLDAAAEWDNVGLLIAPARRAASVARALLTIDLTEAVVQEARRLRCGLIVAYHPPLFRGWKRLSADDPVQRAALLAFAARIPVYSPHTALDAAAGGIADWLIEGLAGSDLAGAARACGDGDFGRAADLGKAVPLQTLLPRIRRLLGVETLRTALPAAGTSHRVRSVAVAAGAGGSVLRGQRVDLWLTGEMSHHDALAAAGAGTAVVLGEHSNTERGYLPRLQRRMTDLLGDGLDVRIAASDRDPFTFV